MLNVEIIKGSVSTFEKQERFEEMVKKFLRGHNVVNIEFEAYPVVTGRELREVQIAYITYDDDLGTGWESLFNYMASNDYKIKDILQAALKATHMGVSIESIERIAEYYSEHDLIDDIVKEKDFEVKPDETI